MSEYIPSEQAKLFGPNMRLGIFWRLDTTPSANLWMGAHNVEAGINSVDPSGTVYLGAGRLMSIPDLEQLINGVADRVEFYLSGADADAFNNLLTNIPPIKGKQVIVGVAPMDDRYKILTNIIPLWTGIADFWQAEVKPNNDTTKNMVRTISLSVGSGSTNRSRNKTMRWTDTDHRVLHPNDSFFSRVVRYTQQYSVTWPRW